MELLLDTCGRRYGRDWIFRNLSTRIHSGSHGIFVGSNGSGKSTLLQVCSGFLSPSEGEIQFHLQGRSIAIDQAYHHLSLAAPYLDLFDDLSLEESIDFHRRFQALRNNIRTSDVIERCELGAHAKKQVKHFSSGMRQRLRLGLAILSDTSLLCLDEPTSNLDRSAIAWYRNLLQDECAERTVLVSTNHNADDYLRTDFTIDLADLKKA